MGVQKFGDWNSLKRLGSISIVNSNIKKAITNSAFIAGLVVQKNAVKGIRNQRSEWPPLAPSTIEHKARTGKSSKTLIADAEMIKSIIVKKVKGTTVFVGIPAGKKSNRGGTPIARYAEAHEFGAIIKRRGSIIRIPKRAWLAPAVKESEKAISGLYTESIQSAVKKIIGK